MVGWDVMTKRYFSESAPDISIISKVLADQSRAAMCAALMNGNAWTVGELGRYVHLSRSTATEHVDKLVEAGIVHDVRQGRHRYVKLANSRTAEFIETLGRFRQRHYQRRKALMRAGRIVRWPRLARAIAILLVCLGCASANALLTMILSPLIGS